MPLNDNCFLVLEGLSLRSGVGLFSKAPDGRTRNNGWKFVKEISNLEVRRFFVIGEQIINGIACFLWLWLLHHQRFSKTDWTII